MAVTTGKQLADKCIDIAKNYKTLYVMGAFGAPLNGDNVDRYCTNHTYNMQRERKSIIRSLANKNYFAFDCSGLIKGVIWNWSGDTSKTYGGAKYEDGDLGDLSANAMIAACTDVSTNFSKIEVGEVVWLDGHIGVYIGNGLAVECTPRWANGVQITAVANIGKKAGYNSRLWTKHGKLPYISYEAEKTAKETKIKGYAGTFPTLPKKGYFAIGDKGENVNRLQSFLNWCISAKLTVDGILGEKTKEAVGKYQKKYGLTVDYLFGKKSLAKAKTIKK